MTKNTQNRHALSSAAGKDGKAGSTLKLGMLLGGAAVVFATTGLINHALAQRAERSNPPEGKFLTVDNVRLHFIERGTGPTIVLLHGNGTMARDFVLSGVFELLCKDHRVIAFDRPGFGFSDRPRGRIWTPDAQAALLQKALARLDVPRGCRGSFLGDARGSCPGAARSLAYRGAGVAVWVLLSDRSRGCSADVLAGGAATGGYS